MCPGKKCLLKKSCHRYTATPGEFVQIYFVDPPNKGKKCDYYWKTEIEKK